MPVEPGPTVNPSQPQRKPHNAWHGLIRAMFQTVRQDLQRSNHLRHELRRLGKR